MCAECVSRYRDPQLEVSEIINILLCVQFEWKHYVRLVNQTNLMHICLSNVFERVKTAVDLIDV